MSSKKLVAVVAAGLVVVGCGAAPATTFTENTDPNANGGGSTMFDADAGLDGLPCDVADVLKTRCLSCHRTPLAGGATMPLTSYAEVTAPSPLGGTYAARSLARMKDMTSPMPPGAPPPASEIAVLETWLNGGAKTGTCGSVQMPDAGPPALTCMSNTTWPTSSRYRESDNMNPGLACYSCHMGQNFKGQNPSGRIAFGKTYYFAGTLFRSANEKDFCNAAPPPNVAVEILDGTGAVKVRMTPFSPSGNFYSRTNLIRPSWVPYTARIVNVADGGIIAKMTTPQTSGDCNTCHTEYGEQGASGRITW